jgi:hypothetical protein
MLSEAELSFVHEHACVPEHLPAFVGAVAGAEPVLDRGYLAYEGGGRLVFVGYPLGRDFDGAEMNEALEAAVRRSGARIVSVAAPVVPASMADRARGPVDRYYRLDLTGFAPPPKIRNMVARAGRELRVTRGQRFGPEHEGLVEEFLESHDPDETTRFIFSRVSDYLRSGAARLYEARDGEGRLVATDVADFSAKAYAFYMFNFRAQARGVPGASDLLLARLVEEATAEGKRYFGLGLGIDAGVTFFKTKWGGVPYLPHHACLSEDASPPRTLLERLLSLFR